MLVPFPRRPSHPIDLHGARWRPQYVLPLVEELREFHWQKRAWLARDLLVQRGTGQVAFFTGQPYDANSFQLVPGGWHRDHCVICRWELFESPDDPQHGIGFTNGRDWLCLECGEKFFVPIAGGEPYDYT
jgi:hypothetical protein